MTPQILGVFYTEKSEKMGAGGTAREFVQKIYWFALQLSPSDFLVFPLDDAHLPLPVIKKVSVKEFISAYVPDPALYRDHAFPLIRDVQEKLRTGQECGPAGKRLLKALGLAKKEIQAPESADQLAKDIVAQASNDPQRLEAIQRQNINTLGIQLRKDRNFDGAIDYYRKALDLNPADDHVHFNIARAYFDKGDLEKSLAYLDHALGINPGFAEAEKFRAYILKTPGAGAGSGAAGAFTTRTAPEKAAAAPAAPTPKTPSHPPETGARAARKAAPEQTDGLFADIDVTDFSMDRRKSPRLSLAQLGLKHICLAQKDGASFKTALLDISRSGAKLLLPRNFEDVINAGDVILLDPRALLNVPNAKPLRCISRWSRDKVFGVMFEEELPLDLDALPDILKQNKPQ